jgi:protein-S-isoprenylcysteine O-methyltransferase Ste14
MKFYFLPVKKNIIILKAMALQEELKQQGDFLFRNRSFLPLIILVIGLGVFVLKKYNEIESPETWFSEAMAYICLAVSLFGLFIRVITVGHTPKNTSGRNTKAGQVADELNTSGIYSSLRHPLYLGNFFMWLGVAMLTENFWFIIAFILFYAFYYERIMYAEEAFLRNKFGNTYMEWAEHTPAIIPSFKNYLGAKYTFSMKKVLKKEKNGLWAVFLLFWIFDLTGDAITDERFEVKPTFWLYAAIISTVVYLVLKIMKRRKLLNESNR